MAYLWAAAYIVVGLIFADAQRPSMSKRMSESNRKALLPIATLFWPVFFTLKLLYKIFTWL